MNRINKYMAMALSVSMILQVGSPVALAAENTSNTDKKTMYFSELEGKDKELTVGAEKLEISGLLASFSDNITAQMQAVINNTPTEENDSADDNQKEGQVSDETEASIALTAETANEFLDTAKPSDSNENRSQIVAGTDDDRMLEGAKNDVLIDETTFPDSNFRDFVKKWDENNDGIFTPEEIGKITAIECKGRNISDLKGVEHFTAITELLCSDNPSLSSLDVSKNTKLQWLRCSNTALTSIDLSANTELIELECNNSRLEQLNLTNNLKLRYLKCMVNRLKSLDVSKNVALEELECAQNQDLFKLDLTANPELRKLNCYYCAVHELDLSQNPELRYLNCQINFLTHLDLSQNTKLENFFAQNNKYRGVKCGTSLSELKGFDKSKVTDILDGGNFDNDKVNFTGDMLSYVYQCNDRFSVDFGIRPIHSGTLVKGQEPTCTEDGWKDYYQCACGKAYKDQGCQTEIPNLEEWKKGEGKIVKKGHNWATPIYSWGADNNSCTVNRVCQTDGAHNEVGNAAISQVQSKNPTCTEKGETTYTATFKESWAEKQTKTIVNLDATGHKWDKPVYEWNINDKICTANRVCKNDGTHIEQENTTISQAQSKNPTCTEKGETTYTATFKESWAEKQTKIIANLDATGHKWSEPVITFAEDCKTATAVFTCQNDSSHVKKQKAVVTSQVKIPATSETMGITTYTATINFNGKTYTATKDVQDIPLIKPEDNVENVIVDNDLTDVPESLMNTEFNTVEKIEKAMSEIVLKDLGVENYNSDAKTLLYDVTLMITENGVSRPATKEELEARGGITVVIPYPTGTNKTDYDFTVAHMLTIDMGGMRVGNIEIPDITFTDDGLEVTLMGLSPVMVGYKKKVSVPGSSEPSKPVAPNKPTEQTEPTVSTAINANTGEQAPKTSDEGKVILWVILGIISLGGVVMLTITRKSKKDNIQ